MLVISLDAVRADALTFLDPATAPNLCALGERGVVFEQAVAGSSWTLPSHAELFTGLPPILHGVHDDALRIDPAHPTLGELASERGMVTAGVWSGWYLSGAYGFDRGFDAYDCALASVPEADSRLAQALRAGGEAEYWAGNLRASESHADITSGRVVERMVEALAGAAPRERLLLFAHFFDPHYDFVPPAPFDERFDPEYQGTLDGANYWRNPRIFDPRRTPRRVVGDRDLEHLRALYRGEVAWCDDRIGVLIEALRKQGRLEHTLIVVVGDHGAEFFAHQNRGHRQTLYDEVLRVPMLIVPPSVEGDDPALRGTRVPDQVALCDVLPTVLDYLGGPPSSPMWGRSLRALIEGRDLPARTVFSTLGMVAVGRSGSVHRLLESFRTPEGKLIRRLRLDSEGHVLGVEDVEWFDYGTDAGELQYPAAGELDAVEAAWAAVELETASLRAFAAELPRSSRRHRATDVREVFSSELDALGYGGGEASEIGLSWPERPPKALDFPASAVRFGR